MENRSWFPLNLRELLSTSRQPWLIHVDCPVKSGLGVWGGWRMGWCEGTHRQASIWPLRHQQGPGDKGGPLLSIRPLLKPRWEFCFAVPLFSAEPHTFSLTSLGMCLLHNNTHGECPHPRWLAIIVIADARNVVQLSKACTKCKHGMWHLKIHRIIFVFLMSDIP